VTQEAELVGVLRGEAPRHPLTAAESAFWRAFARALIVVPRVLDEDLDRSERLSLNQYSVLVFLSESEDRKMRIGDLARRTALTMSGITRLIDRLAHDGLVERQQCATDGRGYDAVLTDHGLERLQKAYPAHLASVRRHVIDHLAGFDLTALSSAFWRVGAESGSEAFPH
jgi:DNA-binding MarR family transcriptional regulator